MHAKIGLTVPKIVSLMLKEEPKNEIHPENISDYLQVD